MIPRIFCNHVIIFVSDVTSALLGPLWWESTNHRWFLVTTIILLLYLCNYLFLFFLLPFFQLTVTFFPLTFFPVSYCPVTFFPVYFFFRFFVTFFPVTFFPVTSFPVSFFPFLFSCYFLSYNHRTQTQTSEVRWAARFSGHWVVTSMFA